MAIITYDNFQLVKNGKIERNYAGMLESTAPTFDDSTAYTAGQYVVHNNEIRKFNEAHPAGAWNDSDNEAASLEDVLTDINTAIADKGVTVPSGCKLVDCPELIGDISSSGGSTVPDADINGNLFKNMFPLMVMNDGVIHTFIDSNMLYQNTNTAYNTKFVLINQNLNISWDKSFEFKFRVSKPSFSNTNYCTVFGASTGNYWEGMALDFGQVNNGDKSAFFGIACAANSSGWAFPLSVPHLALTANKFYDVTAKYTTDFKCTLSVVDDNGLKSNTVYVNSNVSNSGYLRLGGLLTYANNQFNGKIDLKHSYIKINETLVWGCES